MLSRDGFNRVASDSQCRIVRCGIPPSTTTLTSYMDPLATKFPRNFHPGAYIWLQEFGVKGLGAPAVIPQCSPTIMISNHRKPYVCAPYYLFKAAYASKGSSALACAITLAEFVRANDTQAAIFLRLSQPRRLRVCRREGRAPAHQAASPSRRQRRANELRLVYPLTIT
ncbi:hypothetical protein FA95DRAFT_325713 [Auriscalpium vulgare]|uniref:Uncharacterized protein n=1 Tax=Auriscalpium vulgare TaxID=40419 RepID=A0ACB8RIL9_9AGAM|nr:hypothetical protein FA95DRAFT_325713 [Auriscalpium vulgare]